MSAPSCAAKRARHRSVDVRQHDDHRLRVRVVGQVRVEAVDAAAVRDDAAALVERRGQAERIVVLERRDHPIERRLRDHLAGKQRLLPLQQITGRRIQRPGGVRDRHVDVAGIDISGGRLDVAAGAALDDRRVRVVAGILHAERREDVVGDELLVALPADFLDDRAQHQVAGIAVAHFLAGAEVERLVAERDDR